MMSTDGIKMILTYGLAYVIVIGGGYVILTYPAQLDDLLKGAIIGFIGSALTFVFGAEVQTRTARQQERALLTTPQNGYSVTSTQPITANIEPEPASEATS